MRAQPCVGCGLTFPPDRMHFHHPAGVIKLGNVGGMQPIEALEEAKKCILLCTGCHGREHRKDAGPAPLHRKFNQCQMLRIHRGLTRLEVCRLSGLSYTAIKNFESGRKVPRVGTLKGLSKAYNLPIKQVLDTWNRTWVAGRWVTKHGLETPGRRPGAAP